MRKFLKWLAIVVVAAIVAVAIWLYVAPPELIRVGSGYSAKIVCSNVFVAGRDPDEVLSLDVQAPGNPLLRLMRVSVDRDAGVVRAGLFGVLGSVAAQYKAGAGCATVPDGRIDAARARPAAPAAAAGQGDGGIWPSGNEVEPADDTELNAILNDSDLTGAGMRAVVVVKDGHIVGERYGDGFDAGTPLLGWSMTKTVNAALIGTRIRSGNLSLDERSLLRVWRGDDRAEIRLSDMMGMASDLEWNEGYGNVSDVTRMLYLEPDMSRFAASKPLDETDDQGIGDVFNYSSGTAVMLSRIWQNTFDDPASAVAWPRKALFDPLEMSSALIESDEHGTLVGSSYMYATARDWARFGQFLLQRGVWNGKSLLPVGYVDWMTQPHPASGGTYGRGQIWMTASDKSTELPQGTFAMKGHDGQWVVVVPSANLVVVRLGLSPSRQGYQVEPLVAELLRSLDGSS